MATWNLEEEITNFKLKELDAYYKELENLQKSFKRNNELMNFIWDNVLNDESVKKCN